MTQVGLKPGVREFWIRRVVNQQMKKTGAGTGESESQTVVPLDRGNKAVWCCTNDLGDLLQQTRMCSEAQMQNRLHIHSTTKNAF